MPEGERVRVGAEFLSKKQNVKVAGLDIILGQLGTGQNVQTDVNSKVPKSLA